MEGMKLVAVYDAVANASVFNLPEVENAERIVCEWIQSMGMAVGKSVFDTCRWIGVFEAKAESLGIPMHLVYRRDVKMHLCGSTKAKDGNVRQAILDLYPATGGGKTPQIGTKSQPGPLYGITSHAWAALGLGLTFQYSERISQVETVSLHITPV